jgi:cellulose synthase/poly-beta-1,6-N-acetylglucosamine synthase-like glycosyltransferase
MQWIAPTLTILLWFLTVSLGASGLYLLIFAVAGRIRLSQNLPENPPCSRFAVLIPAYKEDAVILTTAREARNQNYPADRYDIVIIADSLKPETLAELNQLPVTIVRVAFTNSTKAKAINKAIDELPGHYDSVIVLDADNIMAPDFISKINQVLQSGKVVVQGHRVARNENTSFALLDAISEEINNHIFRKGHRVLGLSAALIGSGIGFDYRFHKEIMKKVHAIGGYDKELELRILKAGHRIAYVEDAYVYDEKVQNARTFDRQRRRWLAAQWHYFRHFIFDALYNLVTRANVDYMDKVLQFIMPPRVLLLGCSILLTLLSLLPADSRLFPVSLVVLFITVSALVLATPSRFFNRRTLAALATLPQGFWLLFSALFKLRNVNKKFIHTEHSVTEKMPLHGK